MLAVALSLLISSAATAATRYAAPEGSGADPCAKPTKPCSLYTAADKYAPGSTLKAGDVVELAPGTYSELETRAHEIATVVLPEGVAVRGEPGKRRPVIVIRKDEVSSGAFYVPTGAEVADVEIRSRSGNAIDVGGGTLDRVIARSANGGPEATCSFLSGTIRSSACLNSGGGAALGANVTAKGAFEVVIRNSTLIATGPGSVGMEFICQAFKRGMSVTIDGVGVLVRGEEKDMLARGLPLNRGRGAIVSIELRASDYATVETEATHHGRASVTAPGTNGNVTAPPLLGAGNLRQLPGSPTVDRGAIDGASGTLDVDREPRTTSGLPDIGADELGPGAPAINPIPATRLVRHPWSGIPERNAKFTFGSSEPGSRFECKLDQKPYHACVSPYRRKVGLGRHRFQVRAIDPQGQVDRTPAVFRWRVPSWRVLLP